MHLYCSNCIDGCQVLIVQCLVGILFFKNYVLINLMDSDCYTYLILCSYNAVNYGK